MEINIKLNGIRHKNLETLKNSVDSDITTFLQEWYDPKDHVIGHTSGSTGTPKEIRLLKKDMLASARLTNESISAHHPTYCFVYPRTTSREK